MVTTISKQRLIDLNAVLGLDCSKYQININWAQAKAAGIDFAFVKITEGTTYSENDIYNVKARVLDAQKNGVKIGYYHFARPSDIAFPENDAEAEIQNALNHYSILPKPNFPIVLDIEAYAKINVWKDIDKIDHMNRFITTFIQGLQAQNISSIIYSYKSFLDTNSTPMFGTNPLWIAAYLNNPELNLPLIPLGWTEWKIWQFTEQGQINGYNGNIDLDIMKKEYFNQF